MRVTYIRKGGKWRNGKIKGEEGLKKKEEKRKKRKNLKGKSCNTFYMFSFTLLRFSFTPSFVAILHSCIWSHMTETYTVPNFPQSRFIRNIAATTLYFIHNSSLMFAAMLRMWARLKGDWSQGWRNIERQYREEKWMPPPWQECRPPGWLGLNKGSGCQQLALLKTSTGSNTYKEAEELFERRPRKIRNCLWFCHMTPYTAVGWPQRKMQNWTSEVWNWTYRMCSFFLLDFFSSFFFISPLPWSFLLSASTFMYKVTLISFCTSHWRRMLESSRNICC